MGVIDGVAAWLREHLTRGRAEVGMAVCGFGALLTPLLLWISWSPEVLKMVLTFGFGCFLLAIWFAQYAAPETLDPNEERLPKPGEIPLDGKHDSRPESWRDVT